MPNGPTTYPTLSGVVRNAADGIAEFYPATKECLTGIADSIEQMATDLARTRRELADMDALAQRRLEQIDHWSQSHSELAAGYNRLQRSAGHVLDAVVETLNPPRGLDVRWPDVTDAIRRAAAYIAAQPCMCSESELRTDPNAEPCARCKALGRRLDEPVDQ